MTRWPISFLGLLALVVCAGCGGRPKSPDIVLVTIDTLRADRLGCYGYEKPTSVNIDRLAAEGIRYDQCQAPVPITLPSHATMLTGLLPPEHGVRNNGTYRLPEGVPTLAEVLRDHGYRTGAFVSAMPVSSRFGLDRGFEIYDDELPVDPSTVFHFRARAGVDVVNAAADWIGDLRSDEPVFVWVHLFEPHMPYEPPPPFDVQFEGAPYDGEVAAADDAVGLLLRRLQARTRPRVTLVTSDHGEGLGEHGEDTHGMFVYQTTLRVPLILHWPGVIPAGKVENETVGLVDLAPTLLELAGIDPQNSLHPTGIALDPRGPPPRRTFYSESIYALETYQWSPMLALRDGPSKVIRSARDRAYDLATDPAERTDLLSQGPTPWSADLLAEAERLLVELATPRADASRPVSASETQALAALGYVGSSQSEDTDLLKLMDELPDPSESLPDMRTLQRAELEITTGRPAHAIEPLQELLSRTPDNVWGNVVLGRALAETERYDEARQCYERAVALRPGWFELLQNLARLSAATGQTDQALRCYSQALQIDGTQAGLWLEAAGVHQDLGQLDEAISLLERAVAEPELDSDPSGLRDALARLCLQSGRVDEGRTHLAAARRDRPEDPRTLVLEALYLQRDSRWQEMLELLGEPTGALAELGESWLYRGVAQQMLGRSDEAQASFEAALARDESLHLAHNNLAWILATERDHPAEALPHAQRAVAILPGEPEYHDTYLEVLERLGRRGEAKTYLASLIGRFPQHVGLSRRAVRYGLAE